MAEIDLNKLFGGLQIQMEAMLQSGRDAFSHPGAKGTVTEETWRDLLANYLPKRYQVEKAFVVDHQGNCSDEIDIVVFDRHYSPFLLKMGTGIYLPAESVYAVFEVKQSANLSNINYTANKIASVRMLFRTSKSIVNMGQASAPRVIFNILGGFLATSSDWTPAFGKPFKESLEAQEKSGFIDLGYCIDGGGFEQVIDSNQNVSLNIFKSKNSLVNFLLVLLNRLQGLGTVPAIDFEAYRGNIK